MKRCRKTQFKKNTHKKTKKQKQKKKKKNNNKKNNNKKQTAYPLIQRKSSTAECYLNTFEDTENLNALK